MKNEHEPVLANEVVHYLNLDKLAHLHSQALVLDATLGFGGHSIEVVSRGISLVALDTDKNALERARTRLHEACPACVYGNASACTHVRLLHGNFAYLSDILSKDIQKESFDAILFDLGVNSHQLTSETRGMSFMHPESDLDMRLDSQTQSITGYELLNALPQTQLETLLGKVCSYKDSKIFAKRIVERRTLRPFKTVGDFLAVLPSKKGVGIHPATKPFMALRMAVNSELENIQEGLPQALEYLKVGGKLAVISFHSLEDSIVKDMFRNWEKAGRIKQITKKPIIPSETEIQKNPRSRSAKMRVMKKI